MLIQEKVNQAKELLNEFDIDCWITFARESSINGDPILPYIVSADVTWHSAFIIAKNGKTQAIVGKYDKATVVETGAYDEVVDYVEGIHDPFVEYMKKLNPKSIAINYSENSEICDGITHGMFLTLSKMLREIGMEDRIIPADKIISALRERKTAEEIEHMKAAIVHTQEIFGLVANFIKPGKSEEEIAKFMREEVKQRGLKVAWDATVCPSVFTGIPENEAHYAPTDKKAEEGHILNMDFGVYVNDYCSDMQRTFYLMKSNETEVPADVMHGFNTIVESIEKAKQAIKPGLTGKDIDKIARDHIVNNGYDEFPHALGHQVGRFAHDGTAILGPKWEKYASKPDMPLEVGQVFTIEPRLTVKNRGVATIEEMIVVTENGAEWLSTPQKEIIIIK